MPEGKETTEMRMTEFAQMKFDQGYSSKEVWNIISCCFFHTQIEEEIFRQEFLGLHAHELM